MIPTLIALTIILTMAGGALFIGNIYLARHHFLEFIYGVWAGAFPFLVWSMWKNMFTTLRLRSKTLNSEWGKNDSKEKNRRS